jgi:hypothetical protein
MIEGNMIRRTMLVTIAVALAACQSAPPEPAPAVPAAPVIPARANTAVMDRSVTITPPDPNVSPKYAAFSGMWAGSLDGIYDGKLAVRTISSNGQVTVTYAWGNIADNKPGIVDGNGKITGGTLKLLRFPNGADATFTMQPDGTLAATYALAGQTYTGIFRAE